MLDNLPMHNRARDKAWEALIRSKKAKQMLGENFPLERGFYELWCICWHKAWDAGFQSGMDTAADVSKFGGTD